jgi:hypothetical protein
MAARREELAWAAGLFDGEGYVGVYRDPRRQHGCRLDISIFQIDRQVLDRFHQAVGGIGTVRGPYQNAGRALRYFTWRVYSFEKVQAVIAMLWAFLSPVKREQARTALVRMRGYFRGE